MVHSQGAVQVLIATSKPKHLLGPSPNGSLPHKTLGTGAADEVHSWVGIIMYLPEDPAAREAVTQA